MLCKVLLLLYLLTLATHVSPVEVRASPNSTALLPCATSLPPFTDEDEIIRSLIQVSWLANGSDIASFGNTTGHIRDSFSWDTSQFVNGNFSLTVSRTGLDLQGPYNCTVSYNSTVLLSETITLRILASPTLLVPPHWVVLGKESRLECQADGFYPPPVSFSWTRAGSVIQAPLSDDGEQSPDGLFRAVSNLTFHPSQDDQNMTYGCEVTHDGINQVVDFQLNITYLPSVRLSAVPSTSRSAPLTLYCDLVRFYPDQVTVSWIVNGTVLPQRPASEEDPDGTYTTRRYFTLSPELREKAKEVECLVDQPGVTEPVRGSALLEDLDPPDKDPVLTKSAKASVALMCISLVLVFLLCFGFSWKRRDEKQKSLNVSGIILPPRVVVGQKGRVTVSIEGRRVDRVQTTWFLNNTPISDTSLAVSEKGPLLHPRGEAGYYKLHTQGPLHSAGGGSTQQLVSSFTFIPQISVHKGAVFKCQVSYIGKDKVVVEKVSEKFTILASPEVSEIQLAETTNDSVHGGRTIDTCYSQRITCINGHGHYSRSLVLIVMSCPSLDGLYGVCLKGWGKLLLAETDIIAMTVKASRFHPDVITFRWFCQGGELTPVASQALSSPRPDAEGFFSASSQCKLPRGELEKGGTKVWVTVHHIALKQPITRETRGFIRPPCVSEIASSNSSTNHPLTLGCDITGFYPPDILVTWLRLREGEQDDGEDEVIEGGELWGPMQTHAKKYRATATLQREGVKEERKQRGGGVVCRVEHCSLSEPVERRWRDVHIAAPSIPPSISVCWSSEGVGVFSLQLSGGCPGVKLLWAAGGSTLSPLESIETEEMGDDGQKLLKSLCALEMTTHRLSQTDRQPERQMNGHALETSVAVTDPDAEGIEYIDDMLDGENNNTERMKMEVKKEGEKEHSDALHINRVYLRKSSRGEERERLRVDVEITHPALTLPVYRTWTEPVEEASSSL
ncbi:uncharacterized protein si:ch211-180a12.2 [Lampris incognitus]|uniref:uncharacterized protein si:ch211-180a12.2 n=1 Tax=Lampris incognitus TaxID=2546036 RepID=UPI0024B4CCF5|nr:uncharacterized protein si:ch211-180a12.2 [Lampris incognitus]